jgi:signal transduction protein with GAF and PtsI domain
MGHTKKPFTHQFQQERGYFTEFRRALLLKQDQLLLEDLWDRAEFHIPAAEKGAHPLAIASILMAITLEQEKAIFHLQNELAARLLEIQRLEAALQRLATGLEEMRRELKTGLQAAHAELLEARFPADGF